MFKKFGDIHRFLLPPSKALAIVEFDQINEAKAAFKSLAYAPFNGAPLFLEWAPEGLIANDAKHGSIAKESKEPDDANKEKEDEDDDDAKKISKIFSPFINIYICIGF